MNRRVAATMPTSNQSAIQIQIADHFDNMHANGSLVPQLPRAG